MSTEKMFAELAKVETENNARADVVRQMIGAELGRQWDDCQALQKAIAKLENYEIPRGNYQFDEAGWIQAWDRMPHQVTIEERETEFFGDYLANKGMTFDAENDCLMMSVGGALVIGEDGDVYETETGKVAVRANEYSAECLNDDRGDDDPEVDESDDDTRRNALIEQWMQKNGYFPGVFTADRHGNVFAVDTVERKDGAKC